MQGIDANVRKEAWASAGTTTNPYGWLGRIGYFNDPITGQVMIRHRPYGTDLSRFLAADPSGQESNPYTYGMNDPTNLVDPSGLESKKLELQLIVPRGERCTGGPEQRVELLQVRQPEVDDLANQQRRHRVL